MKYRLSNISDKDLRFKVQEMLDRLGDIEEDMLTTFELQVIQTFAVNPRKGAEDANTN